MRRSQWLLRGSFALALAAGLAGCSGDTEILVKVTRDAAAPSAIPTLRVYAAVASGQTMGGAAVYVDQSDAAADVDVSARDLLTQPYTLALKPGGKLPADAGLQIAAVGFRVDSTGAAHAIAFGMIDHPVSFAGGQVLSWDVSLAALTTGGIAVSSLGCIDFTIGGQKIHIGAANDWDCDGDPHGTDCNDLDPAINHMATEICGNNVDEDCSGAIDDDTDNDHDGFFACKGDCIDNPTAVLPGGLTAADVHPGATERLDNVIDENCDGTCEVGPLLDSDKDHYSTTGILTTPSVGGRCMKSDALIDCDDTDKNINPGETENPDNGIDDDCNGICDVDADGDGYTPSGYQEPPVMAHCPKIAGDQVDCDDDPSNDPPTGPKAADIHPGAAEICDGIDENCDGKCDDDADGDGYSVCGTVTSNPANCVVVVPSGGVCGVNQQCDCAPAAMIAHPVPPTGQPVPEHCDGYDENCDGVLFPQDNGCFIAGPNNTCFAGTRQCDDTNATTPWGLCVADPTQPVDPKLCTAYDACFANASVPDPFACAMSSAALGVVGCQEIVGPSSGACTPAFYTIPTLLSPGQCMGESWQIFGGTTQGPWTVGFGDGGGSGDKASGCTALFSAVAWDHSKGSASATRILVTQFLGTTAISVFVDLAAKSSAVCLSPGSNMACSGP